MFALPLVPMVLGFDPRLQFVHEDDVVHALEHAALNDVPGHLQRRRRRRAGALGGDRRCSASGRCRCCRRSAPACSPAPLRRLGFRVPDEMVNLLRFGRGVDNRLYKATGFSYGYTSRETVIRLGEHLRLEPVLRGARARATATSARSRSSCAGARTCAASAPARRASPPTASRSASELPRNLKLDCTVAKSSEVGGSLSLHS